MARHRVIPPPQPDDGSLTPDQEAHRERARRQWERRVQLEGPDAAGPFEWEPRPPWRGDAEWHRKRYGWVPGGGSWSPSHDRGGNYTADGRRIVFRDKDGHLSERVEPGEEAHFDIRECYTGTE